MTRSSSSSISLASSADKRRPILSIDGALDALKPKEMWQGLRGVATPVNGPGGDEARKRGEWWASVNTSLCSFTTPILLAFFDALDE